MLTGTLRVSLTWETLNLTLLFIVQASIGSLVMRGQILKFACWRSYLAAAGRTAIQLKSSGS